MSVFREKHGAVFSGKLRGLSSAAGGHGRKAVRRCAGHGSGLAPVREAPLGNRNLSAMAGQMTVEFVVALPVMLVVAVVAVNAVLFFSECAAFDRLARQAVCTYAAAPGYGQGGAQAAAQVESSLRQSFDREYLDVAVQVQGRSPGYVRYTATLSFTPTLVGRSFSGSVFGVSISPLRHSTSLTLDPYRPGAIV